MNERPGIFLKKPLRRRLSARSWVICGVMLFVLLGVAFFIVAQVSRTGPSSQRAEWKALYHRPGSIPFPPGNPYSIEKAKLGKQLFFDPVFSSTGTYSCASCHNPGMAWGNGLPRAVGVTNQPLAFRVPTLLDAAWVPKPGWDGRFADLEAVAFAPITNPRMMNRTEEDLVVALSARPGYRDAFARSFADKFINRRNIELALATFERVIVSGPSPFDGWIEGDENAISGAAKRGFDLFNGKANCASCHTGWNFTDGAFYDIGMAKENEPGRGRLFPNSVKLQHAFKVPTLRDVAERAPYLHDGSLASLDAVIDAYNSGGIDRPSRSELIKPLGLSAQDKTDLVAFLKTLSESPKPSAPRVPGG